MRSTKPFPALFARLLTGGLLLSSSAALAQFAEPEAVPLLTLTGGTPGDAYGWIGVPVGDLDGDGVQELIVGAQADSTGGTLAGRAYVYSGRTGALLRTVTGRPFDRLGYSVASVGDVDGDRVPDHVISGPGQPSQAPTHPGRAMLYSGRDGSVLREWSGEPASLFGDTVGAPGDLDGDGTPDVLVGASFTSAAAFRVGRVYALSGRDGSVLWTREGAGERNLLGSSVNGLGDVSGDGVPDVIAGARNAGPSSGGLVYVLSGVDGAWLYTLQPDATAGDFGWFFANRAGDVNRDGVPDVYVGDFSDASLGTVGTGRAYVFSGRDGSRLLTLAATEAGEGLGVGRGAGDVNRDGHDDLIIGSYTSSAGAPGGGRVSVYSGRDGTVLRTLTGTVAGDLLGYDAWPMGDANGDGRPDFLITSAGRSSSGTGASSAYVIAGLPSPCPADLDGDRVVNHRDVRILARALGDAGGPADLDGNGTVQVADLLLLLKARGACAP
ncbi:FG-GAP-like repeat-containing protein [Pyxidicoccus sp. 3LG]